MISCTLLGSSGTLPKPDRGLTALYLNIGGDGVLIDCGEGTQVNFTSAKKSFSNLQVICITHCHADHVFGLPGLLVSLDQTLKTSLDMKRDANIVLIAPKASKSVIEALLSALTFAKLRVIKVWIDFGVEESDFEFPKYKIRAFRLCHSIDCYGYVIEEVVNDPFSMSKANSMPISEESWKFLQAGHRIIEDDEVYSVEDITSGKRSGARVVYATDTLPCDNLRRNAIDTDLAVLEGMYFDKETSAVVLESKHMVFTEAAEIAREAGTDTLWLTHFSPSIVYPKDGLPAVHEIFQNAVCGYCGLSKEVFNTAKV